jgi:hypothetical protein
MLRNNISYVLLLLTFILSILDFVKDWDEHKTSFRRWLFLIVTIGATVLAGLSIRWADQKDQENQSEARNDKSRMEGIIQGGQETASKAIGELSDKVGSLETEVKTADLKKQVGDLQAELKATQKALNPGPKAELSFTFLPYPKVPLGQQPSAPVTETTISPNSDGSVHADFTVLNLTSADALDGDLTLTICEECKFVKEPAHFTKLEADSEKERTSHFSQILAKTEYVAMSADILPPPFLRSFSFGVMYRCRTCVLPAGGQGIEGTVHIAGR